MDFLQILWRLLATITILAIGTAITLLFFMFASFTHWALGLLMGGLVAVFFMMFIVRLWSNAPETLLIGSQSKLIRVLMPIVFAVFIGFIAYDIWMEFQLNAE